MPGVKIKVCMSEYCILKTIEELGPISARDIIEITGHTNPSCVSQLMRHGFVVDVGNAIKKYQMAPGIDPDDLLDTNGRIMKYFHDNPGKTSRDVAIALGITLAWPSLLAYNGKLHADKAERAYRYSCHPDFCVWCEDDKSAE